MDNFEELLKVYELADQEQRLQLFMAYRDLREQFQQLDRQAPLSEGSDTIMVGDWSLLGGSREFCRRLQLCWGVLRGRHL